MPGYVQSTSNGFGFGTLSASLTFTNPVAAGDQIIVVVASNDTLTGVSIGDNKNSGNYSQILSLVSGTQVWAGTATVGGSGFQVTANVTDANGVRRLQILEYNAGSVSVSSVENATSTSPFSGVVTPPQSGSTLVGIFSGIGSGTVSAGTNVAYTLREQQNNIQTADLYTEDFVQGTAAAVQATFSLQNSNFWGCGIVVLKPPSAAALISNPTGTATVSGAAKGKGSLASTVTGHSSLSANLKNKSNLASVVSGRSAVSGRLTGSGGLIGKFAKIVIGWNAASDPVDGYNIFRGPSSGNEATTPINSVLVTATTYTDASPIPGSNFYLVKSSLGGVLSSFTNEQGIVSLGSNIAGRATLSAKLLIGACKSSITGATAVSATGTAKGAVASVITGHSSVSARLNQILNSAVHGHATVTGAMTGKGILTSAITGHAVLSPNLKSNGVLASSVTGSAAVSAVISKLALGTITGRAAVSGNLRAAGSLASAVLGTVSVFPAGFGPLGKVTGFSTVGATTRAAGAPVASVNGRSSVFANLGSISLQGCFGQAFLITRLVGLTSLASSISGKAGFSGGVLTVFPVVKNEIHETFTFLATNPSQPYQISARAGETSPFTINEPDNVNGSSTVVIPESNQYMAVSPPTGIEVGGLVLDQFGNLTAPVNKGATISGVVAGGSVLENPA